MATASWPTLVSPYEPRTPSGLSSDSDHPGAAWDGVHVSRPDDQHERRSRQAADRLHEQERATDVDVQGSSGIRLGVRREGDGGEVDDRVEVALAQGLGDRSRIGDVELARG